MSEPVRGTLPSVLEDFSAGLERKVLEGSEDVREVFMQAAVYCGIPAALDSFRVAEAVFAEQEEKK